MRPIHERLTFKCDNRWADLTPHGEGRHCFQCDTTVIDLSRLTLKDALERTSDGACVRLRLGPDGAPLFRGPPPRKSLGGLVVLGALASGCSAPAAASPETPEPPPGLVAAPPGPAAPPMPEGVALTSMVDLDAYDLALAEMRYERGPTREQIALTRAKRRRRTRAAIAPVAQPPHEFLGMMVADDW